MSRPMGLCRRLGIPAFFLLTIPGVAQQAPPKKPPALIRDTAVAEGKTEPEVAVKKEYSPLLAMKNLDVGKQYLKKKNYDAAIQRFRDAIDYDPSLVQAYDNLGRAYEKKGDKAKAVAVYKDFVKMNPDSPKVAEYNSRSSQLEKALQAKK